MHITYTSTQQANSTNEPPTQLDELVLFNNKTAVVHFVSTRHLYCSMSPPCLVKFSLASAEGMVTS